MDAVLALLFFSGGLLEILLATLPGSVGVKVAIVVVTTVPLAWRTAAPLGASALSISGLPMAAVLGVPAQDLLLPSLAPLVAVYSVGVHSSARGMIVAVGISLGAISIAAGVGGSTEVSDVAVITTLLLAALAVGRAVRLMGFESDTLEARAAGLERERDERARAAVAAERARIARELHDVIGHGISVMGVQAGAVRRLLTPTQERERETLLAVERAGREAVTEMRRLLGFLRADGQEDQVREPLPTLRSLDDLVAEVRAAGLVVELQVIGELDDLPPGRALAAFRIVQEALTNSLRHASDARVLATLTRSPGELEIAVVDDGGGHRTALRNGGGYGLVGMRERVALYGGTLEAGPRPNQGFAVIARLPTMD